MMRWLATGVERAKESLIDARLKESWNGIKWKREPYHLQRLHLRPLLWLIWTHFQVPVPTPCVQFDPIIINTRFDKSRKTLTPSPNGIKSSSLIVIPWRISSLFFLAACIAFESGILEPPPNFAPIVAGNLDASRDASSSSAKPASTIALGVDGVLCRSCWSTSLVYKEVGLDVMSIWLISSGGSRLRRVMCQNSLWSKTLSRRSLT